MATPARSATSRMLARLRRRARSSLTARRCPRRSTRAPGTAPPRPRSRTAAHLGATAAVELARAPRRRRRPRRAATCAEARDRVDALPARAAARPGPCRRPRRRSGAPSARSCTRRTSARRRPVPARRPRRPPRGRRATSLPSTIVAGIPKPRARSAMSGVAWLFDVGTEIATPLFSQMKTSGTLPQHRHVQRLEELALARGAVAEEAEHDLPGAAEPRRRARPRPPSGCGPATIAFVETSPTEGSERCIEPPLPLQTPVARPISSAIIPTGSTPLSSASPWPR